MLATIVVITKFEFRWACLPVIPCLPVKHALSSEVQAGKLLSL